MTVEPPTPQNRLGKLALALAVVGVVAGGSWMALARRNESPAAAGPTDDRGERVNRGDRGEPGARGRDQQSAESGATASGDSGGGRDRAISVLTTPVVLRDVPISLDGIGSAVALKTVMVKPQVDGRLDKTTFEEGQAVRRGDLLAQIDPRPFAIMRAQAEAALARDRAQLRASQLTLDRLETVRKQNLIAQQQLDDQRAQVQQLEATIQADQAQLDQARLQLDYARIRSPIDGVTGVRLVDPGNIIRASDPTGIVMVTQLDPIAVLFSLPQDDLPRIATEMAKGPLAVEILSRDGVTRLGTGRLALIDNQINQATASIRLKAVLDNPKRLLWPNQFVKARLLVVIRHNALVLPAVAVQRGPQGTFVYVVAADQKVAARPIKIDTIEGDRAILAGGVSAGEQVVTEGQAQLRPGARVAPRPAGKAASP